MVKKSIYLSKTLVFLATAMMLSGFYKVQEFKLGLNAKTVCEKDKTNPTTRNCGTGGDRR